MKYRGFGKTGVSVSEVGLGTWQLGGSDWGNVDDKQALSILHAAVDGGINFIDTADVYGGGRSEQIISRFLKEIKDKVYVATKLGRRSDGANGWPSNFTLEKIREHTQDSIRRLGVETIFLQQLHCIPTEELKKGEVFEHLRTLKQEGLIQHWGVSVESCDEALICMRHEDCASLQVILNIFRQKVVDEVLPVATRNNVAIIARVPLASGLLTGKFRHGATFDTKDHRNYNADGASFNVGETFAGVPFEKGIDLVEKVRKIASVKETEGLTQMALRWILDQGGVTTVIPGATKIGQVQGNLGASAAPALPRSVHDGLRRLYETEIADAIRGKY